MKPLSVGSAGILLALGLLIYSANAWAAEWKPLAKASTGVFHYDAASVRSTPEGFVRVWIHNVTKKESDLVEIDCKAKSYHVLDVIQYDEASRVKSRETFYDNPTHNWYAISPGSVPELLSLFLCP